MLFDSGCLTTSKLLLSCFRTNVPYFLVFSPTPTGQARVLHKIPTLLGSCTCSMASRTSTLRSSPAMYGQCAQIIDHLVI